MYKVYRRDSDNIPRWIASTLYLEDAQKVLANWSVGYIKQNDRILETKGIQ